MLSVTKRTIMMFRDLCSRRESDCLSGQSLLLNDPCGYRASGDCHHDDQERPRTRQAPGLVAGIGRMPLEMWEPRQLVLAGRCRIGSSVKNSALVKIVVLTGFWDEVGEERWWCRCQGMNVTGWKVNEEAIVIRVPRR